MIAFCEDCGAKNIISAEQANGNILRFMCCECGYSNHYSVGTPLSGASGISTLSATQNRVRSICERNDVIGAFLIGANGQIRFSRMPETLKKRDLKALGQILIGDWRHFEQYENEIDQIHLSIPGRHTLMTKTDADTFLIIICRDRKGVHTMTDSLKKC